MYLLVLTRGGIRWRVGKINGEEGEGDADAYKIRLPSPSDQSLQKRVPLPRRCQEATSLWGIAAWASTDREGAVLRAS